jgi:2-polyprenyl-3-methyl-5-hydroxy-6-metoxy-1,4-benzoquinol methylase
MDNCNVGQAVLDFYKILPFNYYGSIEEHVKSVAQQSPIEELYPPLKGLVTPCKNLLEIGCGAGWVTNSIANNYKKKILGLDFNPHAIERARSVGQKLGLQSEFLCKDLFAFSEEKRINEDCFDLIISLGVLHHTDNCTRAIKAICKNLLMERGHFFVGLYHKYGRGPFLKYFEHLKKLNLSEEELLLKYKELHGLRDETHLQSWFRDQVLHPHETLHTIEEIIHLLPELNCRLVSTSINRFKSIEDQQCLIEEEKKLYKVAEKRLYEKSYFPGFFVFLLQKGKD